MRELLAHVRSLPAFPNVHEYMTAVFDELMASFIASMSDEWLEMKREEENAIRAEHDQREARFRPTRMYAMPPEAPVEVPVRFRNLLHFLADLYSVQRC